MTNDAHLATCHQVLADKIRALLAGAELKGCPMRITQSWRNMEVQAALYAQGRDDLITVNGLRAGIGLSPISSIENGATVTNAPPGDSMHNLMPSLAVDLCYAAGHPYKENGHSLTWLQLGELGEGLSLEWGGRWKGKKRDQPHFQWTGGLTLAQLKAGQHPPMSA